MSYTPAQIKTLEDNLDILIQFNDTAYVYTNPVIDEVYRIITGSDNHDNGLSLFGVLLFSAFSLISECESIEGAGYLAWFMSGLVNTYNQDASVTNLQQDFGQITKRFNETTLQCRKDLTMLRAHPLININKEYTDPFTNHTVKLSDLCYHKLPEYNTPQFTDLLTLHSQGFRNGLVKQELYKSGKYSIAGFAGGSVTPPMNWYDLQFMWQCTSEAGQNGISSEEVPEWKSYNESQYANTTDLTYNGFLKVAGDFCEKAAAAFVSHTKPNENNIVFYHKYYLIVGAHDFWNDSVFADRQFCEWLFKDDGFGTIVRPNSVGMREDIIRNWSIEWGNLIPNA